MNGADVLILVEGDLLGCQRDVSIEETNESIDMSCKDSRARRVIAGRYASTMTLDQVYVPTCTAYLALKTAMRAGDLIQLMVQEEGVITESAMANITSMSKAAPDQDAVVISMSFDIDGEWQTGS
jgi:hypothetical protein